MTPLPLSGKQVQRAHIYKTWSWVDWAPGQEQSLNISFHLLDYATRSRFLSISGVVSKFPATVLNKVRSAGPLGAKWGPLKPNRMESLVLRVQAGPAGTRQKGPLPCWFSVSSEGLSLSKTPGVTWVGWGKGIWGGELRAL